MGQPIGNGLSAKAAQELGLKEGTAVSVGIIDAHAGGIGLLGTSISGEKIDLKILERRLAFIAGTKLQDPFSPDLICSLGTSACHMACSMEPKFISGIWGPYMQAMIPNAWLTEGGQSAVGSLIDHVIDTYVTISDIPLIDQTIVTLRANRSEIKRSKKTAPCSIF